VVFFDADERIPVQKRVGVQGLRFRLPMSAPFKWVSTGGIDLMGVSIGQRQIVDPSNLVTEPRAAARGCKPPSISARALREESKA